VLLVLELLVVDDIVDKLLVDVLVSEVDVVVLARRCTRAHNWLAVAEAMTL